MGCSQKITKLVEDLQNITKQSGIIVAKLLNKNITKKIARVLTIIREKKEEVIKYFTTKMTKKKDDKEEVKIAIKYLKMKHIILYLRPKLTRVKKKKKND